MNYGPYYALYLKKKVRESADGNGLFGDHKPPRYGPQDKRRRVLNVGRIRGLWER